MTREAADVTDELTALLKRRGYLQPSFDLYGGVAGFYDYGPLGSRLKGNLEDLWRRMFVVEEGMAEIQAPTVTPEPVFRASGHLDRFTDPLVECTQCGRDFRGDHLLEDAGYEGAEDLDLEGTTKAIHDAQVRCPACGGELGEARPFHMMFATSIGPGSGRRGYLRPETAQGTFLAFPWLYRYFREKLPFGAVQLGRAYRNEISPRQGFLRLREFNQMEAEVFFDPQDKVWPGFEHVADRAMNLLPREAEDAKPVTAAAAVERGIVANEPVGYFLARTGEFLEAAGIAPERLRFRQHQRNEMSHYSADTWDAEVLSPRYGWTEVVGIADRTDYDLSAHARESGQTITALRRFDEPRQVEIHRVVPDPAKLGPLFRERTGEVTAALEQLDPEAVDPDAELELEVAGETVTVPAEAFTVERATETVAGEPFVPHVVEPAFGVDRILWLVLEGAYDEDGRGWATLKLPPVLAPVEVAVLPLMAKDGLDDVARDLEAELRASGFHTFYDDGGNVGRRYARMDEIGTPFCVTVDYDTLEDGTVTVRDRDTTDQVRVPTADLVGAIEGLLCGELALPDLAG